MQVRAVNIAQAVINVHGPIFQELIELLTDCLQSLGIATSHAINDVSPDRPNVVLGATMFIHPSSFPMIRALASRCVVFQMEALHAQHGYGPQFPAYLEFLRSADQVWDYSRQNLDFLAHLGLTNLHYIPVGFSPRLERIAHAQDAEFDVLFYGAMSERRQHVMNELDSHAIKTMSMFGAYGPTRDDHIGRSKILLNVHQFATSQLEQLRLAYLLNNKCFIISESSDIDPYGGGVVFCDYKDIVACCKSYLEPGMTAQRQRIAQTGYDVLKRIPTRESIATALAALA